MSPSPTSLFFVDIIAILGVDLGVKEVSWGSVGLVVGYKMCLIFLSLSLIFRQYRTNTRRQILHISFIFKFILPDFQNPNLWHLRQMPLTNPLPISARPIPSLPLIFSPLKIPRSHHRTSLLLNLQLTLRCSNSSGTQPLFGHRPILRTTTILTGALTHPGPHILCTRCWNTHLE